MTEAIQATRTRYADEYDKIFKLIVVCRKGSDCHKRLLRIETRLHRRTKAFIQKHSQFFMAKKKRFWAHVKENSVYKEGSDEVVDGKKNNRAIICGVVCRTKMPEEIA